MNYGQTAAIAGIDAAKGEILIPMDADLQNDPADIKRLLINYRRLRRCFRLAKEPSGQADLSQDTVADENGVISVEACRYMITVVR